MKKWFVMVIVGMVRWALFDFRSTNETTNAFTPREEDAGVDQSNNTELLRAQRELL
ncbi:hypothetical protein [Paraliobacillus ryukyuensis]|uniref:hypothetical protein n=1 Tax=Paraliobacillus ryukyuensis TaxID=200904 RepID=UPI0015C4CB81|nr:hypothetical protein [Paraliobacillus ryukyuensis]